MLLTSIESLSPSTAKETQMIKRQFPSGWDEPRVQRLIAHYEQMDENVQVAEDEPALEVEGQTLMIVPTDLVPAIRELIARKSSA
jgi:hypothetical protein